MRKRFLNQKIASGLMAALMLSGTIGLPVAATDDTVRYAVTESYVAEVSMRAGSSELNFSHSGATVVRSVSVADLIAEATGSSVSSEEASYLSSQGIRMTYAEGLSSKLVLTSVIGNSITFTASATEYTAYNGTKVRWVPVSVSVDGKTASFSQGGGAYQASVSGLEVDKVYTASFTYETTINVSAYSLSSVVNKAYDDAQSAISSLNAYEQEKLEYEKAQAMYENALKEYEVLFAKYQIYQQELSEYNTALSAYKAYRKKVDAYEAAMKTYNEYLEAVATYDKRYAEYEAAMAELPKKEEQYAKYLEYLAQLQVVSGQLAALESAFIPDSTGRTMYATLMGDTVAQVIAQKDTLVSAGGVKEADIDNAGDATVALQSLLQSYRSKSGTDAKFRWYVENYGELENNFTKLYQSLSVLGDNIVVRRELKKRDRWERYIQFVAQLYVISAGLDDNTTFSSSWSYYDCSNIYDVIEPSQRVSDDNNASPESTVLPDQMDPVEKPTTPTPPKKPTPVTEPVKTWTEDVADPGDAPAVVSEPKKPTLSDYATSAPQHPQISTQLQAVVDLVQRGGLTARNGAVRDVKKTFTASFSNSVSVSSAPLVTFYDYDGKTVLYSVQVEHGGSANYGGATPKREPDEQYSYEFIGWVDANGKSVSLTNIQQNTAVYAKYKEKVNQYIITWHVAGKTETQSYAYGEIPKYQGPLSYRDDTYQYTFTGWSPAITKVTEHAEYTAQYTARKLDSYTFSVVFKVNGETFYRTYPFGAMPEFYDFEKDYVSGGYRYVFTGWSPELSEVTDDVTYTANFQKMFLIPAGENGEKSAEMTVTKTTHTVITDEYIVNASYAVKEALAAGTQLVLELGGAKVTFDNTALQSLKEAVYFRLAPVSEKSRSAVGSAWNLEITDANGERVALDSEVLVELPVSDEQIGGGNVNAYINGSPIAVTIQDGMAYMRVKESGVMVLRPYYSVSIITEGEGSVIPNEETAEVGSSVILKTLSTKGWELESLMISVDGGEETALALTDGAFTMPNGDIVIRAAFAESEYTVVFMANGVELSREIYHYGDLVTIPEMDDVLSFVKDDVTYTFSGWDSAVAPVVKDVTYTALYKEGNVGIPEQNSYLPPLLVAAIVLLCAATLGAALFLVWRLYDKKYGKGAFLAQIKTLCVKIKVLFSNIWHKVKDLFAKLRKKQ